MVLDDDPRPGTSQTAYRHVLTMINWYLYVLHSMFSTLVPTLVYSAMMKSRLVPLHLHCLHLLPRTKGIHTQSYRCILGLLSKVHRSCSAAIIVFTPLGGAEPCRA